MALLGLIALLTVSATHAAAPAIEPPRLNVPIEEREKRFNLALRGGEDYAERVYGVEYERQS